MTATLSMPIALTDPARLTLAHGDAADRQRIYQLRHEVYARELRQHDTNAAGALRDALDDVNAYIVAKLRGELVGWISITPPEAPQWSIDKYVSRDVLPFTCDDTVYEVRLLTVVRAHRRNRVAGALMFAALRYIEARGGKRIVAIGRREVLSNYLKVGLKPLGRTIESGAVRFELLAATTEEIRAKLDLYAHRLNRLQAQVDWQLDVPMRGPGGCYHGGAFFDAIGDEFDDLSRGKSIVNADVLDAWFPPSPRVTQAIAEHLPWIARTSPPTGCQGMVRAIARARGVDEACVLPGAGSSDLIYLAMTQWLTPASRVLILDPMYGEYAHVLEKVIGCRVDRLQLRSEDDFTLTGEMLARRMKRGYDLVVLVNPNSPTGRYVDRAELLAALKTAPPSMRIWVDETYIDYAGDAQSLETRASEGSGDHSGASIVVCKSMSKVYALSGLRAAYLVGPPAVMEALRPLQPPWAVSLPGQIAAVHALADEPYYRQRRAETRRLRMELVQMLQARFDMRIVPGVANFVLCRLPESGPTAAEVVTRCRAMGVYLRDASTMGVRMGTHMLRIAVKDRPDNERIVAALGEVLRVK